jgi:hypothetical protein
MLHDLSDAKKFAAQVRFSGDSSTGGSPDNRRQVSRLRDLFYTNELLISESVTPDLYEALCAVTKRLSVPTDALDAFVYASSEINAQCFLGDSNKCVIRFSSGLIDILDKNEFEFVAGHEIGHFIYSHLPVSDCPESGSIEYYIQQRAQEISADRLGLIGCDSLSVAIKALIKTISGLNNLHLRFDVGSFLSQLHNFSGEAVWNQYATHPSMLVRCRALLWFSLNDTYNLKLSNYSHEDILKLDRKIEKDIDKYVDVSAKKLISEAKTNLSMWMAAFEIVQKDKFSKFDQDKFKKEYDQKTLDSLINYLNNLSRAEIEKSVFGKVQDARKKLEHLIPKGFEREVGLLSKFDSESATNL